VRSSRRLETECQRNVEVMWLLGRLRFRRMHSAVVTEAGAELVQFARFVGLVKGETVAMDGSKFRFCNASAACARLLRCTHSFGYSQCSSSS
jgi:transposase